MTTELERTIPPPHPNPHAPTAFTPPARCATRTATSSDRRTSSPSPRTARTPRPDAGIEDFERLQDRLGLSRAVFVQASCHGTDNAAMVDAMVRGNGRYAGAALIDESFSDADIASLHEVGVRGTRFNFVAHLGGAPETGRVLAHRQPRRGVRLAPAGAGWSPPQYCSLHRTGGRYALCTMCIGVGQGIAMILERV